MPFLKSIRIHSLFNIYFGINIKTFVKPNKTPANQGGNLFLLFKITDFVIFSRLVITNITLFIGTKFQTLEKS
ncbi:hypothetical protein GCM10008932_00390 [Alkalibacterium iburiense]|uniref:Uncharacterized protein n=1 Tax=Alkalibacterium iburiense TaxID=290589 RepID=A0ABN0WZD7_9LACT